MEIQVNPTVVANNRKPVSILGSFLGTQYYKPEARATWPDFERVKMNVEQAGNVDLIVNRTPRRYRMTGHDILKVEIGQDPTGATNVYMNRGIEGSEVSVPVSPGMEQIGCVSDDAIGNALRGDGNIIFANPSKLAASLNVLNIAERKRCTDLIESLKKMVQQIDSAIAENTEKAKKYDREILDSTPESDPVATDGVKVVVKSAND